MGAYGSPDLSGYEQQNNTSAEKKLWVYCESCGFKYSRKLKKCPQCGRKHSQRFYNKWWFWLFFVLVILSCNSSKNDIEKNTLQSEHTIENEEIQKEQTIEAEKKQKEQPTISEDEYKASCVTLNYDDIARNPNNYIGEKAVFQGQVVQVQEYGKNVVLRVNVTKGEYGIWDDTIYIDYKRKSENESRILEDDIITVYGKMNGIKDYETVWGNQVSIPYLLAEYIDIT